MRLYELLSQNTQQELDQRDQQPPGLADQSAEQEDDGQGKFDADKVDNSLKDIAQSVDDVEPDAPGGAATEPPELDDQNVKPIDDALMAQIKNLPYSKYPVNDNSKLSPMRIAAMSLAELSNLENMVHYKIQDESMRRRVGGSDSFDMKWYADLLNMINTVQKFKKTNTSAQLAGARPAPSYQNLQRPPK